MSQWFADVGRNEFVPPVVGFIQNQYTPPEPTYWLTKTQVPCKCPICDGKGKVQYDPENPFAATSSGQVDWACKPCQGTGILWAP